MDDLTEGSEKFRNAILKDPELVKAWEACSNLPEIVKGNITNLEKVNKALKQGGYDAKYFDNLLASKLDPQKFIDDFIGKIGDNGKFIDDAIEGDYLKYLDRKAKQGKPPRDRSDWKQSSDYMKYDSPTARGNNFNRKAVDNGWYPYNEVHLGNNKRLDSYKPPKNGYPGEIVSRKATDLGDIKLETFESYLDEMVAKYSPGTAINSPKYAGTEIEGSVLKGQMYLEIPASNQSLSNIQEYIDLAKSKNITLRFKVE